MVDRMIVARGQMPGRSAGRLPARGGGGQAVIGLPDCGAYSSDLSRSLHLHAFVVFKMAFVEGADPSTRAIFMALHRRIVRIV